MMCHVKITLYFTVLLCTYSLPVFAQNNQATLFAKEEAFPKVLELNWLNEQFLIKQRKRVETLSRSKLGTPLQTGEQNLPILQRIINESLIEPEDTEALQALGVVLGDAYDAKHRDLEWRVYHDELGKSHAICVINTKHCLFPITMLSRRISAGISPNVDKIFNENFNLLKPHLSRLPFED